MIVSSFIRAAAILCISVSSLALAEDADLEKELQSALQSANPDYKGTGTFRFKDGRIVAINLMRCKGITDLTPLSQFPLSSVTMVVLYNATNVTDISPLRRCRLTSLNLERCAKISDLSPLKGMPLRGFRLYACDGVSDISPLNGMRLRHLDIGLCPQIRDISVLKDMLLNDLRIDNCPNITDISVLRGMPLKLLSLFGCEGIKDYSALAGLDLETIYFTPAQLSPDEIQILRKMKSLQKIGTSWADYRKELEPKSFWKRYDAGDFRD